MIKSLQMKLNFLILFSLLISLVGFYFKFFYSYESLILIAVDLIATIPVIISAINALRERKVSVDLLASIALFVSLINHEWASVAFINLMITSARIFGDYTENKADNAIKSLLKLRPEIVKIKTKNGISNIPIQDVKVGDLVIIETGSRVPVDGIIIEGTGSLDESSLTGESVPITKIKGQQALSSTLNLSGSFIMKAEKVGTDTTFEKVISLIQSAKEEKEGIKGVVDKFASIYISIALVGSILLYIFSHNLNLVLAVLLVACADDIAIAIPMAFWGALAKGAKNGIIIKGASYLEGLTKLDTVVLDKTGTLTKGVIKSEKIICFNNYKSHEVLTLLASVESVSDHPIAKAITLHAKNDGLKINTPEKFEEFAGYGIMAYKGKNKIIAGNLKFLEKENVTLAGNELKIAHDHQKEGFLVVFLAINKKLAGLITLADQIRPESKPTITALRNLGVKNIIMLTGDNELVAARVAESVGITEFHASLLPENKLEYIKKIKQNLPKGRKMAMVGDGVNDAASLTAADIGIAMGAIGSDAAIESANIALMKDNLSKIITAIKLGFYTKQIAKQNFIIWGTVNLIGLTLVFASIIGTEGAAAYNFVTDFIPILNALRIFRYRLT